MRVGAMIATIAFAGVAEAQPKSEAAELYRSAEAAMTDARWADAIRDYGGAYELTKDPVLFYKLGSAYARSGNCKVASTYFARYGREAKPADVTKFAAEAAKRLDECYAATGGKPPEPEPPKPEPDPPTPPPPPADPKPLQPQQPEVPSPVETTAPAPVPAIHAHGSRPAWFAVGSAVTFVTIGAVLAYAARSSEADISDLYVGLGGKTPTFDTATAQRYRDLVDEGNRYKHLSWTAFGLAGASAIAATILFARGSDDTLVVAPSATGATVSAAFRF